MGSDDFKRDVSSGQVNVDLDLLIARLHWPIASTRWWVMQELATLLMADDICRDVEERLRSELRRCRLEAEAVEILCIFWLAAQEGFAVTSRLGPDVTRPSLLASIILGELGETICSPHDPPLAESPSDFEVPPDFDMMGQYGVPQIFLATLQRQQRETGLPLVRQCAFEWSISAKLFSDSYLHGHMDHFIRPIGSRVSGGFVNRAVLRMLSAYQRAIEVAVAQRKLPRQRALALALHASPLNPAIAFLRPKQPSWLPVPRDFAMNSEWVEGHLSVIRSALAASQPRSVLLALSTPIQVSRFEIVELTIVRWSNPRRSAISPTELARRFERQQAKWAYGQTWTVGTVVVLPDVEAEVIQDQETGAIPQAATLGFDRYGYLNRDLFPSRLFYPLMVGHGEQCIASSVDGRLSISDPRGAFADLSYWNAGWGPAHPSSLSGGLCGTSLTADSDAYTARNEERKNHQRFFLWKVLRVSRPHGYGSFGDEEQLFGCQAER